MGSGATAQRITYGASRGELIAVREHEEAMIPILKERGEMELELQKKTFAQYEKFNLLPEALDKQQPVFVTQAPAAKPNYLIYVLMGIAAYFLLR